MTTVADIAREQGVTPQAVAKWRSQAVEKYGDLPFEPVGNRKEYSPEAVQRILEFAPSKPAIQVLPPLSNEPFTTGSMVVVPKVEVVAANGYGKRFDFGSQIQELHFHVHTSNASAYEQQRISADESVQNLIEAALEHAESQGLEDNKEIESIVQAVKSELIKTRVKSAVSGKPLSPDGSSDSAGRSQ